MIPRYLRLSPIMTVSAAALSLLVWYGRQQEADQHETFLASCTAAPQAGENAEQTLMRCEANYAATRAEQQRRSDKAFRDALFLSASLG